MLAGRAAKLKRRAQLTARGVSDTDLKEELTSSFGLPGVPFLLASLLTASQVVPARCQAGLSCCMWLVSWLRVGWSLRTIPMPAAPEGLTRMLAAATPWRMGGRPPSRRSLSLGTLQVAQSGATSLLACTAEVSQWVC